jgi:plasmid stabilization system protein ParE
MVRRITWTGRAERMFSEILSFYYARNGNKTYSRKLNSEIKQSLVLLKKHPYLGRKTDLEDIRVLIIKDFKLFYRIEPIEIIVLMVWDCRQNPDSLDI